MWLVSQFPPKNETDCSLHMCNPRNSIALVGAAAANTAAMLERICIFLYPVPVTYWKRAILSYVVYLLSLSTTVVVYISPTSHTVWPPTMGVLNAFASPPITHLSQPTQNKLLKVCVCVCNFVSFFFFFWNTSFSRVSRCFPSKNRVWRKVLKPSCVSVKNALDILL